MSGSHYGQILFVKAFYQEQIKTDELRGYDLLIEYGHVPNINVSGETGKVEGIDRTAIR